MKTFEAEQLLKYLPSRYDVFPSLAAIEVEIPKFVTAKPKVSEAEKPWVSKRAPGTPASIEAMFILIENNQTESVAFKRHLSRLKVSEDEIMRWYESWFSGKVHPDLDTGRADTVQRNLMASIRLQDIHNA